MKVLVSACLLGLPCRYDGKSKPCERLLKLAEKIELIPFCPEVYGGLPTPRVPSERLDTRVVNKVGVDVTAEYTSGAEQTLRLCRLMHCETALLKEKSPSCGTHSIYDGSFTGALVHGMGVTA